MSKKFSKYLYLNEFTLMAEELGVYNYVLMGSAPRRVPPGIAIFT